MPGTRANPNGLREPIHGFSAAAVTANQVIGGGVALMQGRINGVKASAGTAGSGAGNTVIDVLVNGTSIYTTTANRPTLATASTGEFANTVPDTRGVRAGDRIEIQVVTIPATTGHARVCATVGIEKA